MLAFVAHTHASWESFMNAYSAGEKDHSQDLLSDAEPAERASLYGEQRPLVGLKRLEQTGETKATSRSDFVTILLRALAAWTV